MSEWQWPDVDPELSGTEYKGPSDKVTTLIDRLPIIPPPITTAISVLSLIISIIAMVRS